MNPGAYWRKVVEANGKQSNRKVLETEIRDIEQIEGKANQKMWAMDLYVAGQGDPTVGGFEEWLGKFELPEDLVCAAYLSKEPEIVKLGDQLETLQGAWFPDSATEMEIKEVTHRLGIMLGVV